MGFVFVGGNLALDFVGTLNERTTNRVEHLRVPDDLTDWLLKAGVLTDRPAADRRDLTRALELREALYGLVLALTGRAPARRTDLDLVNAAAAATPPLVRVTRGGRRLRTGDVTAALSAVARDGLDLFDRDDGALIKWCADTTCTHPFLDRSRGHRRRWCDMAACGGRAKARAYRTRERELLHE